MWGLPRGSVVKNPPVDAGDLGWIPGSGRSPGEGNGNPPRKSHGQRSLEGVSPWGRRESDMTEHTCTLGTYVTTRVQKICGKSGSRLQ